jgi:hypothetical protein
MAVAGKRGFYFWVEEKSKAFQILSDLEGRARIKERTPFFEGDDEMSLIQLKIKACYIIRRIWMYKSLLELKKLRKS